MNDEGKSPYPLEYFQGLEDALTSDTGLETAQKWAIWKLASLAVSLEGFVHWPVRALAEEINVSRSLIGVVLTKLYQNNPFSNFFTIERPDAEGGSYAIRAHPWHGEKEAAAVRGRSQHGAIRKLWQDMNTHEITSVDRREISGGSVVLIILQKDDHSL